ncbi:FUSC family protein [Stutzerimonas urumqiensis]|uniref:FUSC family protein n=1 Tax=Stutzerimonas urumqiensis TaxID=638269 RepID=UPI003BA8873F
MRELLPALLLPSPLALRFATKTLFGGLLALWVAMRLGLDQPQWALMTAFIVAQPMAGMVVQKALARIVGTLAGAAMAVLIMAVAAQAPWLFLGWLALWIGLCTASSTLLRSAWSYAFVLAGYTAVLITLPAIGEPTRVFDHAVARCSEILLGIVCATTVSAVLWPQHVSEQLLGQARSTWQATLRMAAAEIADDTAGESGLLPLLGQILAIETQREHAWFEGGEGRCRARAIRALSRALLSLIRTARAVGRQRRDLEPADAALLMPWLRRVDALLQAPDSADPAQLRRELLEQAQPPGSSAGALYLRGRLVLLLDYLARARQALAAVEQGTAVANDDGGFSAHRDLRLAALYGVRAAVALLVLSAFWLATGWGAAVGAIILAAVVCGLFASRENAVQIGFGFLRGIVLAIPASFVCGQLLLPQWSGFAMLALALGVPLWLGALCMARPALMGTATSFSLHFIVLTLPTTGIAPNVANFFNEALGMLLGVGTAVMAFRLFNLRSPRWHGRRLMQATLRDLAALTERRLAGADAWFAGRMTERLIQLARHFPQLPAEQRQRWDDGLVGLDIGDELLHLRLCLAAAHPADRQRQTEGLALLRDSLLRGPAAGRGEALQPAISALGAALESAADGPPRRLGEGAVRQLQRSWNQWCAAQEAVDVA